jgi:hypothetical protein
MGELSALAATLFKQGISRKGVLDGLALLSAQADIADVALKDLARVMPELMGLMAAKGFKGERALTQIGAAMQIIGRGTGGKAEEARTQFNAMIRDVERNAKKLKGKGIEIFDPKTGKLRDLDKLMGEIVQKVDPKEERKFFSDEGLKALAQFRGAFAGGSLDKKAAGLYQAAGTGFKSLEDQFKIAVTGIAAESEKVKRAMAALDEVFQRVGKSAIVWTAQNPAAAAATAVGGYAALKGGGALVRGLLGRLGRGKGIAGAAGGALGGPAGALGIPVFVTNMPGAFSPLGGGAGGPGWRSPGTRCRPCRARCTRLPGAPRVG